MKALVVTTKNRFDVTQIENPSIGPYDALVRIECCGICNSTDLKLIQGSMGWAPPFPFVLGHEAIGVVVEVGSKTRKFKIGDRVIRPTAFWPGSRPDMNVAVGGFAEFGVVRDAKAMAADGDPSLLDDYAAQRQNIVPAGLDAVTASLAISLSETASVLISLPNLRDRTVVVAGAGVVGLAFTLWCKLAGAKVIALGRREQRLAHLLRLGADAIIDTRNGNVAQQIRSAADGDVFGLIEATGDAVLADQMLGALSSDGFACAYGVPPTGTTYSSRWITADVAEQRAFDWVADLIVRGWVCPDWFLSHRWSFGDVLHAFEQVAAGEVVKGIVVMDGER